jgi:hypothetical protein
MSNFLKLLDPYRWLIGGFAMLVLIVAGVFGVQAYNEGLREEGRAEVRAEWKAANETAQAKQDEQIDTADAGLTVEKEVIKKVYIDRIQKVNVYVPSPATACPADPDFVRLYNSTADK